MLDSTIRCACGDTSDEVDGTRKETGDLTTATFRCGEGCETYIQYIPAEPYRKATQLKSYQDRPMIVDIDLPHRKATNPKVAESGDITMKALFDSTNDPGMTIEEWRKSLSSPGGIDDA